MPVARHPGGDFRFLQNGPGWLGLLWSFGARFVVLVLVLVLLFSNWDVSSVTKMSEMFNHAESFDGDLSKWDVSSVTYMTSVFSFAVLFNCDLSKWDVSSVIEMSEMFTYVRSFNGDLLNGMCQA